ncbi:nitronate monooxygenase [Pedobacter sp. PAMC26386]|nr:nitronate monooxygenase [Pedobacter sp. PAMC26386]
MNKTEQLLKQLKIDYPVVQGAMLGVSTPKMAAAVSNAGGLGSLAVGGLSPEKTRQLISETKRYTAKNFAVNLFAHEVPKEIDVLKFSKMQSFIHLFCTAHQIPFELRKAEELKFYSYEEQIDLLIEEKIPVVSFTFGMLSTTVIAALKKNNCLLIGTATSVQEAITLEQNGIDLITAQGIEAGGHRGSFLDPDQLPQIGSMSLIPLVTDAVNTPVLAAGGISDNKALKAAIVLGAAGVQVGSLFIPAEESLAAESYKDAVINSTDIDTVITRTFSGRWARGIKNAFMEAVGNSGLEIPEYVVQNSLTAAMRVYAQQNDHKDFLSMWAGQSASKAIRGKTEDIFLKLIREGW